MAYSPTFHLSHTYLIDVSIFFPQEILWRSEIKYTIYFLSDQHLI